MFVFVTGAELSLMPKGFLPGDTQEDRLALPLSAERHRLREYVGELSVRANDFLYRSAEVADRFAEGVRTLVAQGKPVAITEFGTDAYGTGAVAASHP